MFIPSIALHTKVANPLGNPKNPKNQKNPKILAEAGDWVGIPASGWGFQLLPISLVFFLVFWVFPMDLLPLCVGLCLVWTLQIITYITPEHMGGPYVSHTLHQNIFHFVWSWSKHIKKQPYSKTLNGETSAHPYIYIYIYINIHIYNIYIYIYMYIYIHIYIYIYVFIYIYIY